MCQSKEMAIDAISELGYTQRELVRIETLINDQLAGITAAHKDEIDILKARITRLVGGIQTWCDAHRAELLASGGKEANLVTGLVRWRQRPPSVSIRGADKVLETLRSMGLFRFIRTKEEPNKDAMLADPHAVSDISGITIVTGVEDFVVEPFEVEVTK